MLGHAVRVPRSREARPLARSGDGMNRSLLLAAALAAAVPLAGAPQPAAANAFCPVTIGAVADLGAVGRTGTYGILLDVDRGDTRSVRVRIDTDHTRYALDVNDVPLMTFTGLRLTRYFTLPPDEHPIAAWVQATGLGPTQRLDCPVTSPWSPDAPPTGPTAQANADRDRQAAIDAFSTRTVLIAPQGFGPSTPSTCARPFSPATPLVPLRPPFPPEARAVNATGVVELHLDVDDTGTVVDARVTRSSGFAPLDRAAIVTALAARFAPAIFACRPVATSLDLTTGFGV
jgi:TonB family protein